MTEEWKPISGYEGFYEVSNLGNVRSVDRYVRSGNGNLRKIPSRPKEVVCLNTGRTYKSAAEAARAFGTWPGVISKICLGDRDSFYGYKFKYTGHEKKPRKRKQLNQNDMADMLLSYSIKARESKSKKELKKVIYELKEEMDLKKYDVTEMEMLEGME